MPSPPQSIQIATRAVGDNHPPFMVAEMSANHGGDVKRAKKIIEGAAQAGADAIKFQAYTADSLTLDIDDADFVIGGSSPWAGQRLHDLYIRAATPYDWFPELFAYCRQLNLIPFASPFDRAAVEMLEALQTPAYKIASFEAIDHELISACGETQKPLIISVGLCTRPEITEAIAAAKTSGAQDIILLQCNSAYPSPEEDANLITIPALREEYDLLIGYSDHTLNTTSSVVACGLGACLIEKHVIDSRIPKTADSAFSITPSALNTLVKECRTAWQMRGTVRHGPTESETPNLAFRRSLYAVSEIAQGAKFTSTTVKSIRPGHGLPPKHLPNILGCHSTRAIKKGEPLDWSMIADRRDE